MHHADRYTPLSNTKEGAQVAIVPWIEYDTLTKFVVGDPFAWLKLNFCFHVPISGNSQMEEACRFRAFAQQNFLWILVSLAPQQAAEV